jgi:hypothetical protein
MKEQRQKKPPINRAIQKAYEQKDIKRFCLLIGRMITTSPNALGESTDMFQSILRDIEQRKQDELDKREMELLQ